MHRWVLFRSHLDGWRWEERDECSRIVRESDSGFGTADEALIDLELYLSDELVERVRKVS